MQAEKLSELVKLIAMSGYLDYHGDIEGELVEDADARACTHTLFWVLGRSCRCARDMVRMNAERITWARKVIITMTARGARVYYDGSEPVDVPSFMSTLSKTPDQVVGSPLPTGPSGAGSERVKSKISLPSLTVRSRRTVTEGFPSRTVSWSIMSLHE